MNRNASPFKWRHYAPDVLLLCVRWLQGYAPEINKRIRPHVKMSGTPYRVDETYIKVGKMCKYLYRAVDKER